MRKLTLILVVAAIGAVSVSTAGSASTVRFVHHKRVVCQKLYTVRMAVLAGKRTWRKTVTPSRAAIRRLNKYATCQRNRSAVWYVKWQYERSRRANAWRKAHPPVTWLGPAVASWFDDSTTACGFVASNGFATTDPNIPCGSVVYFRGPSGVSVKGVRDDYGPDPRLGRKWDLRPGLRDALGCGDLCDVYWHY